MTRKCRRIKSAVGAVLLTGVLVAPGLAQDSGLDDLFGALREADGGSAAAIEERIWTEWSKSGSPAMDLLLERGRMALEEGEIDRAIEHFSALIDHAPDFAEGYNGRATAYFQVGLFGPALEDIRQVLARNPRHFGAMGGLALILQEIGEDEAALEAYRAIEEIYPSREGLREAIAQLEKSIAGQDI